MPKNVQTTAQFTHFTCQQGNAQNPPARLQLYVKQELPDVQPGFRKGRGTRDQIFNIPWNMETAGSSRKTSTSALLTMPKPLTLWITTTVENSERHGNARPLDLPPEKSVYRSRSNSLN